jgi:hypothetical protein
VGKPDENRPLRKRRNECIDNIKVDLRERERERERG